MCNTQTDKSNNVLDYLFSVFWEQKKSIINKNLSSNFIMLSIRLGLFSEDFMSIFHI